MICSLFSWFNIGVVKVHDPGIPGIYEDIKPKPWYKNEWPWGYASLTFTFRVILFSRWNGGCPHKDLAKYAYRIIFAYFARFLKKIWMTLGLWVCDLQGHLNVKAWMSSERSWKVAIYICWWIRAYLEYLVNDLGIMHLWPSGSSQGQRVDVIGKLAYTVLYDLWHISHI